MKGTVTYEDTEQTFDVQLYDGNNQNIIEVSAPASREGAVAYAAVYGPDQQMLAIYPVTLTGDTVRMVVDRELYEKAGSAKLFVLTQNRLAPLEESTTVSVPAQ